VKEDRGILEDKDKYILVGHERCSKRVQRRFLLVTYLSMSS
jgi:hypothetical protein